MTRPHIAADPSEGAVVRASVRVARVCELLDCEESQVRRLLDKGEIEGHGFGERGLRVYLDSVAAYQERKVREPRHVQVEKPRNARPARVGLAASRSAMAELQRRGVL